MSTLQLAEDADAADLRTLLAALLRLDLQAAVRLRTQAGVLALYAGTPFEVLAVRGLALREPPQADVDVTVSAQALADGLTGADLALPRQQVATADLALLPPARGWIHEADVDALDVEAGLDQARHAPDDPHQAHSRPGPGGVPLRAFHAARVLGFLVPGEPIGVYRSGDWQRLRGRFGGVCVRTTPAGLPLLG